LRRWALVFEIIDAAGKRPDLARHLDELRLDALAGALDADAREPAERLLASMPDVDASLELAVLRKSPDLVQALDSAAARALHEEADGARMIELAYLVLEHFPALGILVARGAVHEGRPHDSSRLVERMEDARDKLLLSPFEAWWDVYDAMVDDPGETRTALLRADDRAAKVRGELRRAREQSRKASAEVGKLKARLEELDARLSATSATPATSKPPAKPSKRREEPTPPPVAPDAVLEEERRRLRNKVEELQRIIGEGQEERRGLRRRLETLEEEQEQGQEKDASSRSVVDEEDRESLAYAELDVDEPRRVLVPTFSERAAKALSGLEGPAADVVLSIVAGLSSSRENAWAGVKRLEKAKTGYSARAGIHYRVLFTLDEGALRVHEIVHRRDLEQAVNRMVRLG
jgi:hypothetical protein